MKRGEWDNWLCDTVDAAIAGIGHCASKGLPSRRKSVGATREVRNVVAHVQNNPVTIRCDELWSGVRVPSERVTLFHTATAETQHVGSVVKDKRANLLVKGVNTHVDLAIRASLAVRCKKHKR